MNFIHIDGVSDGFVEEVEGTSEWYSCKVSETGICDLYEAEDIVQSGRTYPGMNCKLIHYPDGEVYAPFTQKENVYIDSPVFDDGIFYFLAVDFALEKIRIYSYNPAAKRRSEEAVFEHSEGKGCRNLMLKTAPVTLVRQDDGILQILWPDKREMAMGDTECFYFRDGDNLYCSAWSENPDYSETIIIRDYHTGEVKEQYTGCLKRMPNGDIWVTKKNRE